MLSRTITRRLYSTAQNTAPALHQIPQRWVNLKELDQADIVDYLQIQNQKPWTQLTTDEKRAMYYISFGEWGPRGKEQKSLAATVLRGLFGGVLAISIGVALFNYAVDVEDQQRLNQTIARVTEIKEKEAEIELQKSVKKKWWW